MKPFSFKENFFTKVLSLPKINPAALGTVSGVFIPSFLQMMGITLFLKHGYLISQVGIWLMIGVVLLSSTLLFFSALSLSSIASNMKVGSGGAYFIISRSLGIQFGASLGFLLTLAQLASICLNVTGLSLLLQQLFFASSPLFLIQTFVFFLFLAVSFMGSEKILTLQWVIFLLLIFSAFVLYFFPQVPSFEGVYTYENIGFWAAFSLFFPAATGIETGLSMSGDLKTPSRSIPIGTLAAVGISFFVYIILSFFLFLSSPIEQLYADPLILRSLTNFGYIVILAILGGAISNATGGILGAPRILQALAGDKILPKQFDIRSEGSSPRFAVVVTMVLSFAIIATVSLDQLVPLCSMISLMLYALINFIAFFETILQNPSWRPSFKTPWYISFAGCSGCITIMFMMHPGATFVLLYALCALVLYASKRKIRANLEDLRFSLWSSVVRIATAALESLENNARSWRPHILALSKELDQDENLLHFASSLDQKKGFLTVGISADSLESIQQKETHTKLWLKKLSIPSFVQASYGNNPFIEKVINYGLGSVKPNTVVARVGDFSIEELCELIYTCIRLEKNIVLLRDLGTQPLKIFTQYIQSKHIDLWWGGRYNKNLEFSLVLAYLLQESEFWKGALIRSKTLIHSGSGKQALIEQIEDVYSRLRSQLFSYEMIEKEEGKDLYELMANSSSDAQLVFIGLRSVQENESKETYQHYLSSIIEKSNPVPNVAFVLAGESINFDHIIR